jgi:hypothetical protein
MITAWSYQPLCYAYSQVSRERLTSIMPPRAQIVAQPLADLRSRIGKSRACDDKRPSARAANLQCITGGGGHHGAEDVVRVILYQAIGMNHLGLWRIDSVRDECVMIENKMVEWISDIEVM